MTDDDWLLSILTEPADKARQLAYSDWLEERRRLGEAEVVRSGKMPLDDTDRLAAICVQACRFAPASFDKRFARDVCESVAHDEVDVLSPKQRACLWALTWKYREQIKRRNRLGLFVIHPETRRYLVRVAGWLMGKEAAPEVPVIEVPPEVPVIEVPKESEKSPVTPPADRVST